jgi:hypothetical protein
MRETRRSIPVLLVILALALPVAAQIPSPSEYLGIEIGSDRTLADYTQLERYFRMLDGESPRVRVVDLGETTLGRSMIMAVISSSRNLQNIEELRRTAARLADPRGLAPEEAERLVGSGKTTVLVTCNIHSTEVGSSQMAMLWAHELASAPEGSRQSAWLDDVVLLLVPSLNPDGLQMVVDWYRQNLDSDFEGGRMPWLYHHYVGHDNNRDWYMLTQKETRAMSRAIYHEWFPQIFVDHHQMGSNGPRMFIPPFSDPLDPDIHPLIWREVQLIGTAMAFRLEQQEKAGVIYDYVFDAYWMGGTRNTGWWKNITGLLTETASVKIASPIHVHPTDLRGGSKGLVDYAPQVNFPNPWRGGWWHLRDVIEYQQIASNALLEVSSRFREDFLRNMLVRATSAVDRGAGRMAYHIPRDQRDWPTARRLGQLMADHGLDVFRANNGDLWIPLAHPYSRFAEEILEPQRYPEVRKSGSEEILPPYDVSAWTLPLLMNVVVEKKRMPFDLDPVLIDAPIVAGVQKETTTPVRAPYYAILRSSPESARVVNAALRAGQRVWVALGEQADLVQAPVPVVLEEGTFFISEQAAAAALDHAREADVALLPVTGLPDSRGQMRAPRIALFKPYAFASMDEGWTRYVLEQYGFAVTSVDHATIRAAAEGRRGLAANFDVLILPDIDRHLIEKGERKREETEMHYSPPYPEPYAGGIGEEGIRAVKRFVDDGGTLVAMGSATELVIAHMNVPVVNPLGKTKASEFMSPGAIVRSHVEQSHPVTWGLPGELPLFHRDRRAFTTVIPGSEIERSVLLWYPEEPDRILLSGWIRGEKHLAKKVAAVALEKGRGKMVLFAFNPQRRGQTHATFPLLFNSLYWSVLERSERTERP